MGLTVLPVATMGLTVTAARQSSPPSRAPILTGLGTLRVGVEMGGACGVRKGGVEVKRQARESWLMMFWI